MPEFLVAMATSRFDFDRANRKFTAKRADRSTEEIVTMIREHADSRFTPPRQDWRAPLMDLFIHRLDCLVPLNLPSDRPLAPWTDILYFLAEPRTQRLFIKHSAPDVTLAATDMNWSHGTGPRVEGTAEALGLALAGRAAGLEAQRSRYGPARSPVEPLVLTRGRRFASSCGQEIDEADAPLFGRVTCRHAPSDVGSGA